MKELEVTIWVQSASNFTPADILQKPSPSFVIVKITDRFGDGWNKEFEMLQIEDQFGDDWYK